MKVASDYINRKGITNHLYKHCLVLNVVFHTSSAFFILTCFMVT